MNKTLKLAFSALIGAAVAASAVAQDGQFPDVPENHWVYTALLNMKNNGILVGYPDGMFRGARPASRYELAGAINAAYMKLKSMMDGMQREIDALKNRPMGNADDIAAMRRELDALKAQVAGMARYGEDIEMLKRLMQTFERDLAAIGVDVEAMKRDLADLADRVTALEGHKPAVDFHGDVNLVMHAGHRSSGLMGLTVDQRPTGVGRGIPDLTFGHELGMQVSGTNEEGPQWHATIVIGNMLGEGFIDSSGDSLYGNQSQILPGVPFSEGDETVYIHDIVVRFGTSALGQGFNVEMGRIGHNAGGYFLARQDTTPYMDNARWDDGRHYIDGVNLGFNWSSVDLNVYAGKASSQTAVGGSSFIMRPITAGVATTSFFGFTGIGEMVVDRILGADLGIGLGSSGDLMLHYIFLDTDMVGLGYSRVNVWGGELDLNLGSRLDLNAGYSRTDYGNNSSNVMDEDNAAWWASLGFNVSSAAINLGYREIEAFFGAPGDWGRIGFMWNPTDIQGPFGDIAFNLGSNMRASVAAFLYESAGDIVFGPDDEIFGVNANLDFMLFGDWSANLGWEHVRYELSGSEPTVNWYRIGLSQMMGDSTLSFKYEMSDFDIDAIDGKSGDRKGGFFTTQWSRKF